MPVDFCARIREETKDIHKQAASSRIIQLYMSDKITLKQHAEYLYQSRWVYIPIENRLRFSGYLGELFPLLERGNALEHDADYACKLLSFEPSIVNPWPETRQIIAAFDSAQSMESTLAFAYVHYLGLLNGGQMLQKKVSSLLENYVENDLTDLDSEYDSGVEFYSFENPARLANRFRNYINGAYENGRITDNFIDEVKKVYQLVIAQANHGKPELSACEKYTAAASGFWKRHPYLTGAVTGLAATATVATLAMTLSR